MEAQNRRPRQLRNSFLYVTMFDQSLFQIRAPAEAEKYRLEKIAEAEKNRTVLEAEAEVTR